MFVLLLLLVVGPLVEIAVFVQVAQWIGVLDALGVLILCSVGGLFLVRREGIGTLARMRVELDAGRVPTRHLVDGALLLVAGMLLLIPGFVTDALGLLLLLPPVRAIVKMGLARKFRMQTITRAPQPPRGPYPPDDGRPEILP